MTGAMTNPLVSVIKRDSYYQGGAPRLYLKSVWGLYYIGAHSDEAYRLMLEQLLQQKENIAKIRDAYLDGRLDDTDAGTNSQLNSLLDGLETEAHEALREAAVTSNGE